MAQRGEPHDSLDDFPTPPWAGRALMRHALDVAAPRASCWEPAANRGCLAKALTETFALVRTSDVHDYGVGYEVHDFLMPTVEPDVDWVVTNPPYRLAEQFLFRALEVSTEGVALLVRLQWLEGISRWQNLFEPFPPSQIWQFTERVPMVRGRYDPDAQSATAYCWVIWRHGVIQPKTEFRWIPPCRRRLEQLDDAPPSPGKPADTLTDMDVVLGLERESAE